MQLDFDIWSIVFLIAAAQGVFLSLLIFSYRTATNNLLAGIILLFTISLLYYVAFWTKLADQLPFGFSVILGSTYLMTPLLYFYIRSEKNEVRYDKIQLLPFALYLLYYLFASSLGIDSTTRFIQEVIQILYMVVYVLIMFIWIKRNTETNQESRKAPLLKRQILSSYAGYVLSFASYYLLVWFNLLKIEYDYIISLTAAVFIYYVGYKGLKDAILTKKLNKTKYDRSSLSTSAAKSIMSKIKSHFSAQKPYLDSDLRLEDIARQLSLSTHHISQSVNMIEKINFSDFVNKYRLEEAVEILCIPENRTKKLIDIAYQTGFNNKSSFNNAFKKLKGMSPSEYRMKQANKVPYQRIR